MSQADELLELLSNDGVTALSADPSVEQHIVIDSSRNITVPGQLKRIAVQYDHNIETVTFDCPRYWDGHDMSTMIVYINYKRPDGKVGSYIANNVKIDDVDDSIMHFDWTISNYCTMVSGSLMFLVCIKRTNSDGEEINHWNSELNTEMYVSKGLETENLVEESYPDIITQLLERMDVVEDAAGPIAENTALAAASADTAVKKAAEASTSASNAKTSESNAATSASTASTKANEASTSASNAKTSETNAAKSASTASTKANEASTSASNAKTSETNAENSATAASESASEAASSETNAKKSETNAKTSEINARSFATDAATSETNAENSATAASESASEAASSETNAAASASTASTKANEASASATSASVSASTASTKANEASESATNASTSELNAENSALLAQSWATGGTGLREDEATNNAKYWSTVAKDIAGGDFATKTEAQSYATAAETNAKSYIDGVITDGDFSSKTEAQEYATTAEINAKAYADSLAAEDIDCGTW